MKNQFANDKEFMLALLAYNGTYLQHALLNKDKINHTYRIDEILDELF